MAVAVDHRVQARNGERPLAPLEGAERRCRARPSSCRLRRGVGEGVRDRIARHLLQRRVVEPLLLDRLQEFQRQARPRHAGVVGHERDRDAEAAGRSAAGAARPCTPRIRSLLSGRSRRAPSSPPSRGAARTDRPRSSRPRRGRCAARDRLLDRLRGCESGGSSGGTRPSVSSPACSAIAPSGTAAAGSRASPSADAKSSSAAGASSGCTRLRPTMRGSARRQLEAGEHLREHLLAGGRARHLRDVADGDAAARDRAAACRSASSSRSRASARRAAAARSRRRSREAGGEQRLRAARRRSAIPAGRCARAAAAAPPSGVSISSR